MDMHAPSSAALQISDLQLHEGWLRAATGAIARRMSAGGGAAPRHGEMGSPQIWARAVSEWVVSGGLLVPRSRRPARGQPLSAHWRGCLGVSAPDARRIQRKCVVMASSACSSR
ncbi:hypothetical protein BCR34DRAFT_576658 [Clohesyomyces aquaticus]|uniref:Uncharacterized protein n=1 Tax=Clohesyomyces aquaticus TaxID=1231657 RepID=A0A1Y1YMN3_9PLEO|nr:hypothetical protein BCR34DRAFT_576658 [Clohesyomyces aquaticus]